MGSPTPPIGMAGLVSAQNHPLWSCRRPGQWKAVAEYDEGGEYHDEYDGERYEGEGVMSACDVDSVAFCHERAPEGVYFLALAKSSKVGVDCYDNVHRWQS